MLKTYTKDQLISYWRLRRGLVDLRADCSTERTDGMDVNHLISAEIDAWYANLLATAPANLLPHSQMAPTAIRSLSDAGCLRVLLPDSVVRVVSVRLPGWQRNGEIVDAASYKGRLQSCEWTRGGAQQPVCVIDGRDILLFSPLSGNTFIDDLTCIVTPSDGTFTFDDSLLFI